MNTKATIDKVHSLSRISDVRALDIARLLLDNEALAQSVEDNIEEYPYDVLHDINGLLKSDENFVPRVLVTEEPKPITYADLSDSAKDQVKRDREILISACSIELYPTIQSRYFSWLDHSGHYGFYDLVVSIVDDMLLTPDSIYLKYMSNPDRGDWSLESGTGTCFDWYFQEKANEKLHEYLEGWESGASEDGNFDFVKETFHYYNRYNTIEGEPMEELLRSVGQEEQMLKQLIKKASAEEIINLLKEY